MLQWIHFTPVNADRKEYALNFYTLFIKSSNDPKKAKPSPFCDSNLARMD